MTTKHRIFTTSVASVYPYYVAKAEKKGRTKAEVEAIICWLTGYNQRQLIFGGPCRVPDPEFASFGVLGRPSVVFSVVFLPLFRLFSPQNNIGNGSELG
jgi:hypothetical protein